MASFNVVKDQLVGPTAKAPKAFKAGDVVIREPPVVLVPDSRMVSSAMAKGKVPPGGEVIKTLQVAVASGLPFDFFFPLEVCERTLSPAALKTFLETLHSPLSKEVPPPKGSTSKPPPTVPLSISYSRTELVGVAALLTDRQKYFTNSYWDEASAGGNGKHRDPNSGGATGNGGNKKSSGEENSSGKDQTQQQTMRDLEDLVASFEDVPTEELLQSYQARLICSVIHGLRVNTHSDETTGVGAVFPTAAKFAHSCSPNTFWHFERDHKTKQVTGAVHIASRTIAKDELISFSYVGTGLNVMSHTLHRRHQLSVLNFVCRCKRCSLFDEGQETCRTFRCHRCPVAPNRSQTNVFSVSLQPKAHGGWYCDKCHEVVNVASQLRAEEELNGSVLFWFFGKQALTGHSQEGQKAGIPKAMKRCAELERVVMEETEAGGIMQSDAAKAAAAGGGNNSSSAENTAAPVNGLIKRWVLLEGVRSRLGATHYLSAVAIVGFARCIIQASVDFEAAGGKNTSTPQQRGGRGGGGGNGGGKPDPDLTGFVKYYSLADARLDAECTAKGTGDFVGQLFRMVMEVHRWFESNMKGSPQHIKVSVMLSEMILTLNQAVEQRNKQGGAGGATRPEDEGKIKELLSMEKLSLELLKKHRERTLLPLITVFCGMQDFPTTKLSPELVFGLTSAGQ